MSLFANAHRVDLLVFGERELDDAALADARLSHDAGRCAVSLLSDIGRCVDGAARRRSILAAIQKAGFQWLCYSRIQCIGEQIREAAWFDGYSPPGWLECVRSGGFFDVDPRIGLARIRDWPFAWDLDCLFADRQARSSHPSAQRFIENMEKVGMGSGVTIGLPAGQVSERAIVTLSSPRANRRAMTDATMGEAYAIALAMHAFIAPRLQRCIARPATDALSDMQLAVLRFVAHGFGNREIAERLRSSIHVVAHHLRQLEHKYAARNRVQLAYFAGRILNESQTDVRAAREPRGHCG
ncbi:MAG TPA: autoinducer binding domain-containing protein [Trinickia sp.]|nr:autoinducer binding domain-containing protein [Trinickia sp.]